MIRNITFALIIGLGFATNLLAAGASKQHIEDFEFSFEGPFGRFDQHQLQRGLQVYTEVCASCHGLEHVAIRTLADPGGPSLEISQVKAYAKQFDVFDPELDDIRSAIPSDKFPSSGMLSAPDLSLMAKARAGFHGPYGLGINQIVKGMGGAEYIASILSGYTGHEKEEADEILYENTAFPGGWISMPPPLEDDLVEYRDNHSSTVHHMSEDVSAFLMWAAEPKMMARKTMGLVAVMLLSLLAVLLYFTNKRLWAPIKRKQTKI
jgi:ubiquinol-cytochrome c reductase cytochrome c1 subunit